MTKHAKYLYSEKNRHISGPTEFKPMLFKGQEYAIMYIHCFEIFIEVKFTSH